VNWINENIEDSDMNLDNFIDKLGKSLREDFD
jgi:hypothetical protein